METIEKKMSKPARREAAKQETKYSSDQLIEAFHSGMKYGQSTNDMMPVIIQINVDKTAEQAEMIVNHVMEAGFHPIDTYIKVKEWNSFKIIITVPEDEWCDEGFLPILGWLGKLEAGLFSNSYLLETFFIGIEDDSFDEPSVYADGYIKISAA